jgi:DNA-directed RNA polymerase subunit M/transcription elongation factor TFIIS
MIEGFTGRIPIKNNCPKCSGILHHTTKNTLKCESCDYLESTAENIKRNVTYFINGKQYTQEEVKKLQL